MSAAGMAENPVVQDQAMAGQAVQAMEVVVMMAAQFPAEVLMPAEKQKLKGLSASWLH